MEAFPPGDAERVERARRDLETLGVRDLRLRVPPAEYRSAEGERWYSWLLPRLARRARILACFGPDPPARIDENDLASLASFLDRLGRYCDAVEIGREAVLAASGPQESEAAGRRLHALAARFGDRPRQGGPTLVLGDVRADDAFTVQRLARSGILKHVGAIGVRDFPEGARTGVRGWREVLSPLREALDRSGYEGELWVTETGYAAGRSAEHLQLRAFVEALEAPVARVYWLGGKDRTPAPEEPGSTEPGERAAGFGLRRSSGEGKLLHRVWSAGGLAAIGELAGRPQPFRTAARRQPAVLVTGGAGFIGTNLAARLLDQGQRVVLFDSLARPGVERNARWLKERYGERVEIALGEIRDRAALRPVVRGARAVFHLAAQVAVTRSIVDPIEDFEVNALGTLNLLEEIRRVEPPPPLVFTSTNKVYGALEDLDLAVNGLRYLPTNRTIRERGIGATRPLDLYSPYGCSKGCADQYVLDYARIFGLPAVVFRMSCIYGPHQLGNEDQGWVAHFLLQLLEGNPITLYGDGRQVRDVLFVDDLVAALLAAWKKISTVSGKAFNVGGGPGNAISLLELVSQIERLAGSKVRLRFGPWRPGDQKYYVSDIDSFRAASGWRPRTSVAAGVSRLFHWLRAERSRERAVARSAG